MKLYHGSIVTVKYPSIQKGRKATDFGKGFYTTTNFEQAKKWAILKKNREQSNKAIIFSIVGFRFFGLRVQQKNGWSLSLIIAGAKETTTMI